MLIFDKVKQMWRFDIKEYEAKLMSMHDLHKRLSQIENNVVKYNANIERLHKSIIAIEDVVKLSKSIDDADSIVEKLKNVTTTAKDTLRELNEHNAIRQYDKYDNANNRLNKIEKWIDRLRDDDEDDGE